MHIQHTLVISSNQGELLNTLSSHKGLTALAMTKDQHEELEQLMRTYLTLSKRTVRRNREYRDHMHADGWWFVLAVFLTVFWIAQYVAWCNGDFSLGALSVNFMIMLVVWTAVCTHPRPRATECVRPRVYEFNIAANKLLGERLVNIKRYDDEDQTLTLNLRVNID